MPIPHAQKATVHPEKLRDYLLNLEHPDGGSKAIWLQSLGYTRNRWRDLADDLLDIAQQCAEYESTTTQFGVKYIAVGLIGRKENPKFKVRTIWIQEGTDPPRLITAYPDEAT